MRLPTQSAEGAGGKQGMTGRETIILPFIGILLPLVTMFLPCLPTLLHLTSLTRASKLKPSFY